MWGTDLGITWQPHLGGYSWAVMDGLFADEGWIDEGAGAFSAFNAIIIDIINMLLPFLILCSC